MQALRLQRHQRNNSYSSISSSASSSSSVTKPPRLFWALASDNVDEVERLLASGEADANDTAGPDDLPALLFTMQNDALKNRTEIVKTLLAYGADPGVLQELAAIPSGDVREEEESGESADDDDDDGRRDSMVTVKALVDRRLSDHVRQDRRMSRRITLGMNPAIESVAQSPCSIVSRADSSPVATT